MSFNTYERELFLNNIFGRTLYWESDNYVSRLIPEAAGRFIETNINCLEKHEADALSKLAQSSFPNGFMTSAEPHDNEKWKLGNYTGKWRIKIVLGKNEINKVMLSTQKVSELLTLLKATQKAHQEIQESRELARLLMTVSTSSQQTATRPGADRKEALETKESKKEYKSE